MPNADGMTQSLLRLKALLAVLSDDWQDRLDLIRQAGCYPDNEASARVMFCADVKALRELGFTIEQSEGRQPAYCLTDRVAQGGYTYRSSRSERIRIAVRLKTLGLTHTQIAYALAISKQRVGQMLEAADFPADQRQAVPPGSGGSPNTWREDE